MDQKSFQCKRRRAISGNGLAGNLRAPGNGIVFWPPELPGNFATGDCCGETGPPNKDSFEPKLGKPFDIGAIVRLILLSSISKVLVTNFRSDVTRGVKPEVPRTRRLPTGLMFFLTDWLYVGGTALTFQRPFKRPRIYVLCPDLVLHGKLNDFFPWLISKATERIRSSFRRSWKESRA